MPRPTLWTSGVQIKNEYVSNRAILETTNDNGSFLSGTFSFDAQNDNIESVRSTSEGDFSIAFDRY